MEKTFIKYIRRTGPYSFGGAETFLPKNLIIEQCPKIAIFCQKTAKNDKFVPVSYAYHDNIYTKTL